MELVTDEEAQLFMEVFAPRALYDVYAALDWARSFVRYAQLSEASRNMACKWLDRYLLLIEGKPVHFVDEQRSRVAAMQSHIRAATKAAAACLAVEASISSVLARLEDILPLYNEDMCEN